MTKNKKIWYKILLTVCVLSLLIGTGLFFFLKEEKTVRIIFISKCIDEKNDFWNALMAGANMAAKEYNAELTITAAKTEIDYEEQNRLIEEAIKQKPDVIMLAPADYVKTLPVAKKIKEHHIRLVLVDCGLEENIEDIRVSTNNYEAGYKVGEYMATFMEKDTKAAIISHVKGNSSAMEREKGIKAALGENASQIVDTVYSDSDFEKAYEVTKELLQENPDITVLAGTNEYSAVGAAQAVKELGLSDRIRFVGFDNSVTEAQLLEEGVFEGIVVQKPFNIGYLGVEKAVELCKGRELGSFIDSGSELITRETMYTPENEKLLFPFWGK